jgi:outer membrane protein assembly factor BamB
MKIKLISVLLVVFLFSLTSCTANKQKPGVSSFIPFPSVNQKFLGPSNPKVKWIYEWEEVHNVNEKQDTDIVLPVNNPSIDGQGKIYLNNQSKYFGPQGNIFVLTPEGRLLSNSSQSVARNIVGLHQGILIQNNEVLDKAKVFYINQEGIKQKEYAIANSFLGQDQFLYGLRFKETWFTPFLDKLQLKYSLMWNSSMKDLYRLEIISLDWNSNLRWNYSVPDINKKGGMLEKCFSDTKGNIYFIFDLFSTGKEQKKGIYTSEIVSLTSTGKFRWKNTFSTKRIDQDSYRTHYDIIPRNLTVSNSFLVYETKLDSSANKEFILQCLSTTDGNLLWENKLQNEQELKVPYTILDETTFLVSIQDINLDKTYLRAVSSENGKILWEKEIDSKHCTSPIVDSQGNIYIGAGGADKKPSTIYSYTSLGSLRWSMVQTNPDQAFGTNLVLGSNHSLYYGLQEMNLLYCIGDK